MYFYIVNDGIDFCSGEKDGEISMINRQRLLMKIPTALFLV